VCLAMSVISVVITGGRLAPAVAVLAGGLLAFLAGRPAQAQGGAT